MYEMEGPRTSSVHVPAIAHLPCLPRTGPGASQPALLVAQLPYRALPVCRR